MAYQHMDEDVERYKKLLGEWNQASRGSAPVPGAESRIEIPSNHGPQSRPAPRQDSGSAPRSAASAEPTRSADSSSARVRMAAPAPASAEGRFSSGSILCLNDEELVIYRRPVTGKPLDMVYSLLADGAVKIDGVDFNGYRVEEIGQLPPGHLKTLQADMRWTRKMLAPHCFMPEDAERIPDPDADYGQAPSHQPRGETVGDTDVPQSTFNKAIQQESAVRLEPDENDDAQARPQGKIRIRRGQTIQIKMGYNNWEAVYWGRDTKGSVVAHNTHNHWQLMHFDLARYKDSMTVSPEPDALLIQQISNDLSTQQKESAK